MQQNTFYIDRFISVLALYFLLQVVIRVFLSPNVGLDEAEQLLLTQNFAWGYNAQPPLYTWIQTLLFKIFGSSIFALALLKNILLFLTYFFYFKSAQLISQNSTIASIATASLFLIPQISWESQRALTHSVLLTTIASVTLYYLLYLKYRVKNFHYSHYLILGVLFLFGFLAKYSFLIFIIAIIAASILDKKLQGFFLNKRIVLTITLFTLLSLPHILWVVEHLSLVTAPTIHKLQPIKGNYLQGVLQFFIALIEFLLLMIIPLILFWKTFTIPSNNFLRTFLISATIVLLLFVLISQASNFKDRWLQPYFFLVPLFLATKIESSKLTNRTIRLFFTIIYSLMLFVVIATIVRVYFPDILKHPPRLNYPFAQISNEIKKAGFHKGFIIAENKVIGGNMKINFPQSTVSADGFKQPFKKEQQILIVWHKSFPPQAKRFQKLINIKRDITLPFRYSKKAFFTLHIAIVNNL